MERITIKTNVDASALKTWTYYTTPEHITQWNFALDSWHCPRAMNDMRIGGKLVARMEAKDGSEGFYFEGTYNDILFEKRISYVLSDNRSVLVEFKNNSNNKIDVIVTFDSENETPLDIQREGWQLILDNFKKYVESN